MSPTTRPPWWLIGGTERCALCVQRYAVEMEVRCAACDRGVCTHCAVHVRETQEVFCTACEPDAEEA